jgi:hypothetical protein
MTDALRLLRQLSRQERWLLAQAWLLLIVADLALRFLPLTALVQYTRRQRSPRREVSLSVARLAWVVETAGRHCPTGTSCLKEALVLAWLLARRGMPTTLRIGVSHRAGSFAAHAWLEQNGRVILGGNTLAAYTPLWSCTLEYDRP